MDDRELEDHVLRFFTSRHVPGLRNLRVRANQGIVTVSGKVLTFYEKQLCNQVCRMVPGIAEFINAVDVSGVQGQETPHVPHLAPAMIALG
ncbi:MAG: BON domain-containing protein [Pirellulales bacterium]